MKKLSVSAATIAALVLCCSGSASAQTVWSYAEDPIRMTATATVGSKETGLFGLSCTDTPRFVAFIMSDTVYTTGSGGKTRTDAAGLLFAFAVGDRFPQLVQFDPAVDGIHGSIVPEDHPLIGELRAGRNVLAMEQDGQALMSFGLSGSSRAIEALIDYCSSDRRYAGQVTATAPTPAAPTTATGEGPVRDPASVPTGPAFSAPVMNGSEISAASLGLDVLVAGWWAAGSDPLRDHDSYIFQIRNTTDTRLYDVSWVLMPHNGEGYVPVSGGTQRSEIEPGGRLGVEIFADFPADRYMACVSRPDGRGGFLALVGEYAAVETSPQSIRVEPMAAPQIRNVTADPCAKLARATELYGSG